MYMIIDNMLLITCVFQYLYTSYASVLFMNDILVVIGRSRFEECNLKVTHVYEYNQKMIFLIASIESLYDDDK